MKNLVCNVQQSTMSRNQLTLSNTNSRRSSSRQQEQNENFVKPSITKGNRYINNDGQSSSSSSSSSSCNSSPINASSRYKSKFWKFRKSTVQMLLIGLCLGVTFGIFIPILDDFDCNRSSSLSTDNQIMGEPKIFENKQIQKQREEGSLPSSYFNNNNNKLPTAQRQLQQQEQGNGIQRNQFEKPNKSHYLNYKNISNNKSTGVEAESTVEKEKMKRPRYFSTELGLRNKIIVGIILSDTNHLDNILAINETLSTSHIDKLLFFIGGTESANIVIKLKTLGVLGVIEVQDLNNKLGETSVYSRLKNTKDSSTKSSNTNNNNNNTSSSSSNFNYNKTFLKVIKYFGERFGETYDNFFLSTDNYYINGRHLVNSVSQISVSQDIIWGIPSTFSCSLEKGFVISRRIIQKLSTRIDRCMSNPSLNLHNNVGKCIYFLLNGKYTCQNIVDGIKYSSIPVNSSSQKLTSALTVGPVPFASDMFKVHGQIFKSKFHEIQETILYLQNHILNLHPKIPMKNQKITWPIGIPSGTIPKSRFDVLKWNFFDQNYIYGTSEISAFKKLDGIDRKDLQHVIKYATKLFQQQQQLPSTFNNKQQQQDIYDSNFQLEFHHGYRRFNPTRGMEYILDFQFKTITDAIKKRGNKKVVQTKYDDDDNNGHNFIRIEGVRPVCKMEVISMPFVNDNHRTVTIILPVKTETVQQIHKFLDRFFDFSTDQKLNSVLIIAIIIKKSHLTTVTTTMKNKKINKINLETGNNPLFLNSSSPSSSSSSITQDQVQEIKNLISYYNRKTPRAVSDSMKAGYIIIPTTSTLGTTSSTAFLSTIDGVIKRIVGTSSLLLTVDTNVNIKDEFLNRVRMNTIMNRQVFSPIPFIEHNPSVYRDKKKLQGGNPVPELEISRNSGYFDQNIFRYFSFFAADYVTVRKLVNLKELENFSDFSVLEHVFIKSSSLHVLRSPEPALKIPFSFGLFSKSPSECSSLEDCIKTNWGTRGQLAKIIFSFVNPPQHNMLKNKP